jgi:hypothetical protein
MTNFFGPNGFNSFRFHHFVLLNKENKTLRIHVLIIDLGTLFDSSPFHYLLSSTNQRRSIRLTNP